MHVISLQLQPQNESTHVRKYRDKTLRDGEIPSLEHKQHVARSGPQIHSTILLAAISCASQFLLVLGTPSRALELTHCCTHAYIAPS
jgi:hypothetical protein